MLSGKENKRRSHKRMKKEVLLSIIVPVFNAEKYITRCIDSILSQTFNDYELILINDGSTDGTYDILEKYRNNSKCIVLHQKNRGVSVARNVGIEIATGRFISFVDADDYLSNNYFDVLVPLLNNNPQLVSFNSFYEYKKTILDNIIDLLMMGFIVLVR